MTRGMVPPSASACHFIVPFRCKVGGQDRAGVSIRTHRFGSARAPGHGAGCRIWPTERWRSHSKGLSVSREGGRTVMTYRAIVADTLMIRGHGGAEIESYYARPQGSGAFPGV